MTQNSSREIEVRERKNKKKTAREMAAMFLIATLILSAPYLLAAK